MQYFVAGLLGAVQGLTEFLPISSEGHLFIVRAIFHLEDQGVLFDAILHFGTLIAIFVVLRREWWKILRGAVSMLRTRHIWETTEQKMISLIVLATIPGALAGFFLENIFANAFRDIISISLWILATGSFYFFAEYAIQQSSQKQLPSLVGAIWLGLAQAMALLPGVSRSGMTIATGRLIGMSRSAAAKFSFLMAGPIVLGATLFSFMKSLQAPVAPLHEQWRMMLIGVVTAFVVGYFALRGLLRYLKTHSLRVFGVYMLGLGAVLLLLSAFGFIG